MNYDNKAIIFLCLPMFFAIFLVAQQPAEKAKDIATPTSVQQAKEILDQACELEKEQKYEEASARYDALLRFFLKQAKKNGQYAKIIHIKLDDDFNQTQALIPDAVEFLVQIRKKGYFHIQKAKNTPPEMDYCEINERLIAMPRQVNIEITEDFYRQGTIHPEEATLTLLENGNPSNKLPVPITEKEKFKPGQYRLSIAKPGYETILDDVTIFPGETPFLIVREMRSKPRKIQYRIQGDFIPWSTEQITPDVISVNGQSILQGGSVKPGQYELAIQKDGYEPIVKKLMIEPEERPFSIAEYMRSCPREIQFRITGDDKVPFQPDEITLNGKSVKHGDKVKPDTYRLTITKRGCNAITERLVVEPKNAPFVVERAIVLPSRRIEVRITALFPKELRLTPDVCTLNGMDALQHSFAPGEYTIEIKRSGYKTIRKQIQIIADDAPYVVNEVMEPNPRHVELEVSQEMPHENPYMKPQATLVNEKTQETIAWKEEISVSPESYILKIEMNGFEADISKHLIMPLDEPYKIARNLVASPRNLITRIVAEYTHDEVLIPDEMALDNRTITKDFKVKPGTHDLAILKEGYIPIRKSIKIGANSRDYIILESLVPQDRLVHIKFFDAQGRQILPDETMLGNNRYTPETPLLLKPGIYRLRAKLKGYALLEDNVYLPVGTVPYTIERRMISSGSGQSSDSANTSKTDIASRPRVLKVNLSYDDQPSEGLRNRCIVSLIDKKSQIACYVSDGIKVKPGVYSLAVDMPRYVFGLPKEIEILPGDQAYEMECKLVKGNDKPTAKSRPLLLNIDSPDITLVWPFQVLVHGKPYSWKETFSSGSELELAVQFKGYKTVHKHAKVLPGEGPFVVNIPLQPLKSYTFRIPENTLTYDLYADGEKIEDHLIETEKGNGFLRYKVWADSNAKLLQVYAGYEFGLIQLDSLPTEIVGLNNIGISRLIEHLESLSKGERGHREALEILEKTIKEPHVQTMLKKCASLEIGQFLQYIEGWEDIKDPSECARMKIVLDTIGSLKNKK